MSSGFAGEGRERNMENKKPCCLHRELLRRNDDYGVEKKREKMVENRVGIESWDRKESPNRIIWLFCSFLDKTRLTDTSENTHDITHTG